MVVTYSSYDEAADHVGVEECVAGAYHEESGDPIYFVIRKDISDFEMRMKAFEVRYGKPMTEYGKRVLTEAIGGGTS